jgi:hypothetical protein
MHDRLRHIVGRSALYLGALSLLAVGGDHIEQYYVDNYSVVPTIGALFFLNFVSAVVVATGLVAPLRRLAGRFADAVRASFALAAIGIGAGSLVGLFVSESTGLFGFTQYGYPTPVVVSIAAEAATIVFLATFLAANGLGLRAIRASGPAPA